MKKVAVGQFSGNTPAFRPVARWLTLATVLLILYGSLYPFQFSALGEIGLWELLRSLGFQRTSRADLVANLLLYMPLGLCLMLSWPGGWRRVKGIFWALLFGTLLSLTVEILQVHATSRVSSITDVVVNVGGTLIGALLAITYLALGSTIRIPGSALGRPEPVPLGVLLLWLAFRLAPFVPTFDWQKYQDAIKPLIFEPSFAPTEVFRYFVGWLVVGYAVRQIWRREYAVYALAVIALGVLLGRVIIVGKNLVAAELLALVLSIPAAALLAMAADRRRTAALALLLAALIVLQGLEPYTFVAQAREFSWVPFKNSLSDSIEVNYSVLLEKCFWYFSLVWLLARRGFGVGISAVTTALLLGVLETLQMWLPGRSAEITDPLLALVAGLLLALLGVGATQGPSFARSRSRRS